MGPELQGQAWSGGRLGTWPVFKVLERMGQAGMRGAGQRSAACGWEL